MAGAAHLWILRHAKSSWDDAELDDFSRPLAPRGKRACRALRLYCAEHHIQPDVILCSTARRARDTLEEIRPALGDADFRYDDSWYHADAETWLETLRFLKAPSALIVGHNPGLHALATGLAAPGPTRDRIVGKLPTGALLTFTHAGWETLGPGTAELVDVVFPRELD